MDLYRISPTDYLKYNQLVSSIPKEWKTQLKTENIILQQNHSMFDKLLKNDNDKILFYKYQLLNETTPEFKQQAKWKQDVNNDDIKWNNIYSDTFISTIDSKRRNFQDKFLMRIISTNVLL